MMKKTNTIPAWLMTSSILAVVIGVMLGVYFYSSQKRRAHSNINEELAVVANLKVNQITAWREERLSDANLVLKNPLIRTGWLPNELGLDESSLEYLQNVKQENHYCNVVMVDPVLLKAMDIDGNPIDLHDPAIAILDDVFKGDTVIFSGIHLGACNDKPHIDLAIPYENVAGGVNRVLFLQIGTEEFLYPLLQSWPSASTTGETLLIQQTGDEVLFLNDLRHVENAALDFQIPLSEDDVPAVMAVKGITGPVEGLDYRGIPVLAVIQSVPETDWYMISKMDLKEVNQEWLLQTNATIAAVVLLMATIIVSAFFLWQRGENDHAIKELRISQALNQSEALFRSYVENVPDGFFISDQHGNYTAVNPAACEMTGYSQEELLKMNLIEMVPPEAAAAAREHFETLQRTGTSIGEVPFKTKAGEVRYWMVKAVRLSDEAFLAFSTDITDQHRAFALLQELQEKYDTALDVTEEGIWDADLATDQVYWPEKYNRLFGEAHEMHRFSTWQDRLHPDDAQDVIDSLDAHLRGVTPMWQAQFRLKTGDGSWIWVIGKGRVIEWDENRQPLRMVGTISDITDLKMLQAMLDYRQVQLEKILNILPVGIWLANLQGDLYFANAEAERIWGGKRLVSAEDYQFFNGWRLPSRQKVQPDEWSILHSIRDGVVIEDELLEIEGFDGTRHIILTNTSPLFDAQGNIEGGIEINYDITSLHQAQETVRALNADLEQRVEERTAQLQSANEEMEAFVYSVSHDLRAPLRAIDGYSHFLRDQYGDLLDQEGARYLQTISENISRMNHLIDGLLNLSKINRFELDYQIVDSNALVKKIVVNLQAQYQAPDNEFLIDELPSVRGDEVLLYQVWHNLLENAVKYSRNVEQPLIKVTAQASEGFIIFSVRDNGVGFDNQYAGNLFGVFQRLHSVKDYDGVGVGLAIVDRIIKRHGGEVWAEGEEGNGAIFSFSLPIM